MNRPVQVVRNHKVENKFMSKAMGGAECVWDVDGMRYTGLAWGPEDGVRVLALHGWMDHAESFATLAPLLTGCRVVALDLSGHGHSGHRAAHATYNIWDDLPQIIAIVDRLEWQDCVLMGHSRGANIGVLLAAAMPEKVQAFVALDSLISEPTDGTIVSSLRAFLTETPSQRAKPPRHFSSREEYITRRVAQGNDPKIAESLADRALLSVANGVEMRADRRLFASSAVKLTQADIDAVLAALSCPVLNIWASEGIKATRVKVSAFADLAKERIAIYETHDVEGHHHFHMVPEAAQTIAGLTLDFLRRHHL